MGFINESHITQIKSMSCNNKNKQTNGNMSKLVIS